MRCDLLVFLQMLLLKLQLLSLVTLTLTRSQLVQNEDRLLFISHRGGECWFV